MEEITRRGKTKLQLHGKGSQESDPGFELEPGLPRSPHCLIFYFCFILEGRGTQ